MESAIKRKHAQIPPSRGSSNGRPDRKDSWPSPCTPVRVARLGQAAPRLACTQRFRRQSRIGKVIDGDWREILCWNLMRFDVTRPVMSSNNTQENDAA